MAAGIAGLPELDVHAAEFIRDPHAVLRPLRGTPIARSARGIELLTYEACEAVLRDPAISVGFEELLAEAGLGEGPVFRCFATNNLNNVEGDDHVRMRKVIAPRFAPAKVEGLRARIRVEIEQRLDQVEPAGRCDLVEVLGRWLPSTTWCLMAGTPLDDRAFIWQKSDEVQRFFDRDPSHRELVQSGFAEVADYIDALIDARRHEPGDDLISDLLAAHEASEITLEELRDLAVLLILASTDTTNSQLVSVFKALADHPEQWERIRAEPDLVPGAVLEGARYEPGVWAMIRVARAPVQVAGHDVPGGTNLFVNFIGANRDPAVFHAPDDFDVGRDLPRPPLNWSLGRHFCPGRPVAVLEIEEALRASSQRWDALVVDGEFTTRGAPYVQSALSLPVRFEPADRSGAPAVAQ